MSVSEPVLSLVARPVQSREDWEAVARLTTDYMPHAPVSTEQVIHHASELPNDVFVLREILSLEGRDVASLRLIEPFWTEARSVLDGRIHIAYAPSQAAIYRAGIDRLIRSCPSAGYDAIRVWSNSEFAEFHQVLIDFGFVEGQRNPECILEVAAFDPMPFLPAIDRAKAAGYELIDVVEFKRRNPETWKHELWRLDDDIMRDVPLPEPWKGVAFETFSKMLDEPTLRFEGMFVAVKDGQLAGQSEIHWNALDPRLGNTGLTGIRREHRRQGLATALKTASLLWARSVGIEKVFTDNEENNPMRDINLAMGFKTAFEWIEMTRPIAL